MPGEGRAAPGGSGEGWGRQPEGRGAALRAGGGSCWGVCGAGLGLKGLHAALTEQGRVTAGVRGMLRAA